MLKASRCIRPVCSDDEAALAAAAGERRRREALNCCEPVGAAAAQFLLPLVEGAHPTAGLRAQAERIVWFLRCRISLYSTPPERGERNEFKRKKNEKVQAEALVKTFKKETSFPAALSCAFPLDELRCARPRRCPLERTLASRGARLP